MFEEEAENTGRELAISWVNFHYDPAVKITRQGLESAYRAGHKDGAEFGYNEALKEVDDICTEEAIYHARLEELIDRINWDGPEVKESEDEKLLKAIKDYAAHGHKDSTPFDIALCIEQAIDNAEDNKWHFVKNGDLPEDFKDVLICDIHKNCMVGQRNSTAEENYVWEVTEDFMPDKEVIAWKEIEPPEIEEE